MPLKIELVTVPYSEVGRVEALESDLTQKDELIAAKDQALDNLTVERNKLISDVEFMQSELTTYKTTTQNLTQRVQTQAKELETALNEIIVLKTPPLPTAPQKISRTVLPRIYGLTIEKSKEAPSSSLYTKVKTAMKWGASMGFNYWRGFFNTQEISEHLKTAPVWGNLITYGQSLGLGFIADTIDTVHFKITDDVAYKIYLDSLIKLGCEGVYINDANRAELPLDTLKAMVARIRRLAPEMPIFASLLATVNLATYKELVDHVEIQTFGTPSELANFLALDDKLPYPVIVCLDARTAMTANDLATRAAIILKNPPNQFFYYADLPGDYDAMPDSEDIVIKGLVGLLKARA